MDAKHTPEPWGYSQDDWRGQTSEFDWYIRGDIHEDWGEDNDDDFPTVVSTAVAIAKGNATSGDIQHANARRIVSAVNSVAGIPTEALEGGVIAEMVEALVRAYLATSELRKDHGQIDGSCAEILRVLYRCSGSEKLKAHEPG